MKVYSFGALLVFMTALAAPAAAQEGHSQHEAKKPAMHAQHMTGDADFVSMMLMHHQQGIKMSQAVITDGQSEEVKRLAQKIMDGQKRESEELESLKSKVGGAAKSMPMEHDPEMKKMHAQMEKLDKASGAEADKMFVEMMTHHHQMAIDMSEAVMPKLKNEEVRAFAQKTAENQKKEIAELQAVR